MQICMSIEELIDYHCRQRKASFHAGKKLQGIDVRKKIHFLIDLILMADRALSGEKIVMVRELNPLDDSRPHIFACTHSGGNDIQRAFQVIRKPAYLMLGDPGILYRKIIYQGLRMNGVIPLETADREDRKIAFSRAVELLSKGGNLLIFPEGAWNVSPNEFVMKIFNGTVRMARESGADITPIAIEQYGKSFFFNAGNTYSIAGNDPRSVKEMNDELREKLATLKWEIMENQDRLARAAIPEQHLKEFQDEIIARCNYGYGFALEDALREKFHDKNVSSVEEVFDFLRQLEVNQNNAFLMRQKLEFQSR